MSDEHLQNRLLQNIMESAPVGMVLLNAQRCLQYANTAFCDALGYELDDLLGIKVTDLIHDDDAEAAVQSLARVDGVNLSRYTAERRYRRRDGTTVWFLASVSVLRDPISSNADNLVVQYTNIDGQKRAEAALAESDHRWSVALESARQGVWDHDRARGISFFSPTWRQMRGMAPDEDVSSAFEDLLEDVHPDDRAHVVEQVRAHEAGEINEIAYEYRQRHRDGRWVWLYSRGRAIEWDDKGRPTRIIGTDTDIDRQKRAEHEISDAENRWNFALESAGQGVWDHDHINQVSFHSPMWRQMRGMAPDDPIPETMEKWLEHIHPDDRDRVREVVIAQDSGQLEEISYEFRERHKDGHWIWVYSRGRAISWDDKGVPTRIIGTDTDISNMKISEERLAHTSKRLELALTTSLVGVWSENLVTKRVYWDDRMMELYGLHQPAGDMPPDKWQDMVHADDREMVVNGLRSAVKAEKPVFSQFRIYRPDGEERIVRARTAFHRDSDGKPRLIGINWDVTEDVHRAEELERAKELADLRANQLEVARMEMEHVALHDALTGLPNRRSLDEALDAIASASDEDQSISLLHVDLDRFKQINDTLGHAAGDAMLVHAAQILQRELKNGDMVARIGGDEFVLLVRSGATHAGLGAIAARIVQKMSQPVPYKGHECRFGVSIGIAHRHGRDIDARQMLVNADIALYRAKRKGRNRYEFFTDALQAEIVATKRTADDVLNGLDRGEFLAYYQPQFDANTFDMVGVEALARWQHPQKGLLTPDKFLQIADDLSVVHKIDHAVLEQSLAHLEAFEKAGVYIPKVSVNVSAHRLHDEELLSSLKTLDFDPGRISFELLESVFLDKSEEMIGWNIDQIRDLGIDVEIDDFGTGHASIVGLLKLRPKRLKIARELVQPITHSDQQRRLVGSIVEIGRSLGIEVLAEGVETMEHVRMLADLGCDSLQGYVFAHPMSAAALKDFLMTQAWRESPPTRISASA